MKLIGPNFNIGVFCGALALRSVPELIWAGGLVANIGIFMPGILLITAVIPFWTQYRQNVIIKTILKGVSASAVGLVFAAIYQLGVVSVSPINSNPSTNIAQYPFYMSISAMTFTLVGFLNLPAPLAIVLGGLLGFISFLV